MNANEIIKECENITSEDTEEIQLRTKRQLKDICEGLK